MPLSHPLLQTLIKNILLGNYVGDFMRAAWWGVAGRKTAFICAVNLPVVLLDEQVGAKP